MTESIILKFSKGMECSLCNKTLFDPRNLPCNHTFCKECLDELTVFQNDGSASVKCPNNCGGFVKIGIADTISSTLSVIYMFQHMLDILKEAKGTNLSMCQDETNCQAVASHSCVTCSKKTCKSCWQKHPCESKHSVTVVFDERYETYQPLCEEHNSYAVNVCFDCENKFVCIYCINREHKSHNHDSLLNQAASTRVTLSTQLNDIRKVTPKSSINYKDEMEKIVPIREQLEVELQQRILKKLNKYAILLYSEKDKILRQFDTDVNNFKTDLDEFGLMEKDFDKAFSSYIDKVIGKEDFELISERNTEIIQKAETLVSTHCFNVALTNHSGIQENLLGQLETRSFTQKSPENSNIIQFCNDKTYDDAVQRVEDLSNLVKCMTKEDLSISTNGLYGNHGNALKIYFALYLKTETEKTDGELINFMRNRTKTYSFDEISDVINNDQIDCLKLLLRWHPEIVHLKDITSKKTLLHVSAGKYEALSLFLQTNCEHINDQDKYGYTALIFAAENGHSTSVEILIQHNADLNIKDNDGYTALMCAAMNNHSTSVEILIQHNPDLNIKNNGGNTALIYAAMNGHSTSVEILIQHNADLNIKDNDGSTALMCAAMNDHSTSVEILIQHNADLNIKNNDGDTALILATIRNNLNCVTLLLQHNADINIKNNEGKTAYDRARNDAIKSIINEHIT